MRNKINAYQQVLNQSHKENVSYRVFDSIKKYIIDGTNQDYKRQVRLKMLGNGSLLCYLTLEHMSGELSEEYANSIIRIVYKIGEKIRQEIKTEFSQDFDDAYNALEELKKATI